jgi:hypothetical protein
LGLEQDAEERAGHLSPAESTQVIAYILRENKMPVGKSRSGRRIGDWARFAFS